MKDYRPPKGDYGAYAPGHGSKESLALGAEYLANPGEGFTAFKGTAAFS